MLALNMARKQDKEVVSIGAFTAENNVLVLDIKMINGTEDYSLEGKTVTAIFEGKPETGPLVNTDGIIRLPITNDLIIAGWNDIQLNFRWLDRLEQSPVFAWHINKSLLPTGIAQESVDILTALIAQVQLINDEGGRVVDLAGDLRIALDNSTELANTAKQNVEDSVGVAEATKGALDESTGNAILIQEILADEEIGTIKRAVDTNAALAAITNTANQSKGALDLSIGTAGETKEALDGSNTTAGETKEALDLSIGAGGNTKAAIDESITAAGTTKTALDESTDDANLIQEILADEVLGTIKIAVDTNAALAATTNTANQSKAALDLSIGAGGTTKTALDGSIGEAGTAKTALDGSINTSGQSKAALDLSIGAGGTTKTALDGSIGTAGTTKTALDGSIVAAGTAQGTLNTKIVEAGTAQTNLAAAIIANEVVTKPVYDAQVLVYATDKKPFQYNHALQEYINVGKFWDNLRDGRIYTTEFNQFGVSPLSTGVKKDDNIDKVVVPSTNIVAGRDDYNKIGLFKAIDVNGYVDINDDYHVTAIKGDGKFKNDGTNGDVYVMAMTGYQKYKTDNLKWSISYSDAMHAGYEIIDEAVKPDGTIRPYLLHAKYVAGRNPLGGKLASISNVYPEYINMSHNGQITEFKAKGTQYSGKTSHDDYYVQLMMWLKYATMNSQAIMKGTEYYYVQYTPSITEIGVTRFIVTNAQASNLLVGSTVSIGDYGAGGINEDRAAAQNFNIANRVKITSIEPLPDGLNTAINLATVTPFTTTPKSTITTYPWNSGGCDNVLGVDGSPYNNLSGKEPFIINGIEMMVGGYEILQNLIIVNNAVDNRIDVYANYDCVTYATSITVAYDLVGQLAQTNNTWQYGSKIVIPSNHPSIMLITETIASSTTGTGDAIYTNAPSAGGTREWLSLGRLPLGPFLGLRCLHANNSLAYAYWAVLGRLSATGRSRRRAGVN